jgi:hypothetical protein
MLEEESKKWRKVLGIKRDTRANEGHNLLAKLREQKGLTNKPRVSVEVLYASSKIENQIVFGYCYLLMEHKNPTALQFLTENMKAPLENKELFS